MRLVTFFAVGGDHFSRVQFMALGALRNLSMDVMTRETVKEAMLALIASELGNLQSVAVQTVILALK